MLGALHLTRNGPLVLLGIKHFVLTGPKSFAVLEFVGDRAGKVAHDGPGRIGAELVAPSVVKFVDCPHQGNVAVANQTKKIVARADVPLGDRHHQPQIRLDKTILDFDRLFVQLLNAIHQAVRGPCRYQIRAQLMRSVLQIIVFSEQMMLLFARQQRHVVQGCQVRRQPGRNAGRSPRVIAARQRSQDHLVRIRLIEVLVMHVVQRQFQQSPSSRFVDDSVDRCASPAEPFSQSGYGLTATVVSIDALLHLVRQGTAAFGKQRQFRVLFVK